MKDTKVTDLALIDSISNAFSTVCHDVLLDFLFCLVISSEALEWFCFYLQGRQQCIHVEEVSSSWCYLLTGIPRGDIISPLLSQDL